MDIKLPISTNLTLPTLNVATASGLELKLNQLLPAKIIETQMLLNTLSVQLGEKAVALQAEQPLKVSPGQTIELQVSKLLPTPEFKLISPPPAPGEPQPRLTLVAKVVTSTAAAVNKAIATTTASMVNDEQAVEGQRFTAKVISISPQKLTLLPMPALSTEQSSHPDKAQLSTTTSTTVIPAPTFAVTTPATTSTPTIKPLILDVKQLFIAAADLPKQQAISVEFQPSKHQNLPQVTATDNRTLYVPINKVAGLLLKPEMSIELQLLNKDPVPAFVISFPKDGNTPTLAAIQKQLLPIQVPLQPLLQHLQQLAGPALHETGTAGEILQHLALNILRDLPPKTSLMQPAQLKQCVENSGLFMESKLVKLLKQPALSPLPLPLQEDFKFKLSKLADAVKQFLEMPKTNPGSPQNIEIDLLKQTLTKTQGALAKLTLEQLNSLPKDDSNKQNWIIELPFFNPPATNSVLLEIEQDQAGNSESKQKNWSVSITISPPDLGTIYCKLSCYDGSVNSRFWSESADTVEKINGHLDYLQQQFELKGLVAGFMEAHQGKPIVTDNPKRPPASLLSVKA